ncbi:MAG: aspartyl-tRNA amidotransferase [Candidatus Omnitrophica bacterium CG12_big_fil_rev_8_21_14_0_65_43_15]|uniref:Aspartyl-tRNA amidotransferase n=1 Tax=Candidatus Taenaricola geysiri TaxID=1974752 RepID=A0A2J0LG31_9BACT|nr:MAG: hypothetical protein AUJ89_02835 [Candidatus Omnitrophica bacterium CG1_02_43_210]PIR65585.1 MAG: aspartyl-tRNA amidotransferase [Candidatus Omnitrophica bacterium CG10_big_fil_rev_8_21_14_0_10_43_8]PIV12444.1 MAG: aspartyl-tRNA amidotransferase [Candidatus Omnitrophica bacterium CG03_land_8_20_14_0_80_43_22]PIW66791.1 MAG: aspartyl-tRNA amidotransferase [Candidatus Omnitrophica bacterium CG12_big_fil_rev_8_21_14_0_65_43_15]PIW80401.1 MAG: aspartyl-tRNA amidotransferase [Candidatus Omni
MLQDKINKDLIDAMKSGDAVKVSTLRMLNSAFKNIIIAKKLQKLEDTDVIDVISKQVKQRAESIDQFKKGNRQDLVDKETKELDILKTYLPEQMGEEELTKLAQDTIKEVGATGKQDMGKVMKAIMPKAKGRCDSKLLSEIVGKCLN